MGRDDDTANAECNETQKLLGKPSLVLGFKKTTVPRANKESTGNVPGGNFLILAGIFRMHISRIASRSQNRNLHHKHTITQGISTDVCSCRSIKRLRLITPHISTALQTLLSDLLGPEAS